jgi:AcrR family transcriptional regulator
MPTPDRTSLDAIILAARDLLETAGLAGVTMQAVAERVGVRAPSLYKRVPGRDDLIRLVAEGTLRALTERLDGEIDARELADSLRAFGKERPAAFQLVMSPGAGIPVAAPGFGAAASGPILRAATELAGEHRALEAARTLTAWATGFISMELNGAFNLGGDIDDAWDFGITTIVHALSSGRQTSGA